MKFNHILFTLACSFLGIGLSAQAFSGKTFAVLSDADMSASAYIDGKLNPIPNQSDSLIFIKMPDTLGSSPIIESIAAENSVTNWTKSMSLSRDSNFVIVAPSRLFPNQGTEQVKRVFDDFPPSYHLLAYPLKEGGKIDTVRVGPNPFAVAMHPNQAFVASVIDSAGSEIALTQFKNGAFGKTFYFPIGVQTSIKIRATDITWHPSGNFLALSLEETGMVAFYQLKYLGNFPVIQMINSPLRIGKLPGAGRFTPDGKQYLIPDLNDWINPGRMLVIRPDFKKNGKHGAVAYANLKRAPETFAISPDGKQVVVINMEGSHFPEGHEAKTKYSTIQLFDRDPYSGKLSEKTSIKYDGILPQSVCFDKDGKTIAVLAFQFQGKPNGGIDFFEITDQNELIRLSDSQIELARGAHTMLLID